jgi:hypothetical protein
MERISAHHLSFVLVIEIARHELSQEFIRATHPVTSRTNHLRGNIRAVPDETEKVFFVTRAPGARPQSWSHQRSGGFPSLRAISF